MYFDLCYHVPMKKFLSTFFVGMVAWVASVVPAAAQEEEISADDLLYVMRSMTVNQGETDVMGAIRKGGKKVPSCRRHVFFFPSGSHKNHVLF